MASFSRRRQRLLLLLMLISLAAAAMAKPTHLCKHESVMSDEDGIDKIDWTKVLAELPQKYFGRKGQTTRNAHSSPVGTVEDVSGGAEYGTAQVPANASRNDGGDGSSSGSNSSGDSPPALIQSKSHSMDGSMETFVAGEIQSTRAMPMLVSAFREMIGERSTNTQHHTEGVYGAPIHQGGSFAASFDNGVGAGNSNGSGAFTQFSAPNHNNPLVHPGSEHHANQVQNPPTWKRHKKQKKRDGRNGGKRRHRGRHAADRPWKRGKRRSAPPGGGGASQRGDRKRKHEKARGSLRRPRRKEKMRRRHRAKPRKRQRDNRPRR